MKIYFVKLISPDGSEDIKSYSDPSEIIQLTAFSENGEYLKSFESEAYHADSWARTNGFVLKYAEVEIQLDGLIWE